MEALTDTAEFYLKLRAFNKDQILERRLAETQGKRLVEMSLASFATDVASEKPVPGGGSVSAYGGALAASLVSMVSRLTLKRAELEKHWSMAKEILVECESLQRNLLSLVDEDSEGFAALMQAYRLPKQSEQEKRKRAEEIQSRLKGAAEVPLKTAEQAAKILSEAKSLAEFANENALSDLQTAIHLAYASAQGAISNVTINLYGIKDEDYRKQTKTKLDAIQRQTENDKLAGLSTLAKRSKTV
jgi:formiminotetrahydrofolate cyclodeaminase